MITSDFTVCNDLNSEYKDKDMSLLKEGDREVENNLLSSEEGRGGEVVASEDRDRYVCVVYEGEEKNSQDDLINNDTCL